MAWSHLQSANYTQAGGGSTATTAFAQYSSNLTSGSKLIALVSIGVAASQTINSVKDANSNSFTLIKDTGFGTNLRMALFALDTPAADVGTKPVITATTSGGGGISLMIQEVSGLATGNTVAAMIDGGAAAIGSVIGTGAVPPTVSYTSTASNEYLVCCFGDPGNGVTYTNPSTGGYGTTDANGVNTNLTADVNIAYTNSTGGSENNHYTISASEEVAEIMCAFLLPGSSTPATPKPIVVAKPRRNKGVVFYRKAPPVFTAPTQKPIVRSFLRRNKGVAFFRKAPPVFTAPTQKPLIRTFLRRNKGSSHLQTFTTTTTPPSQKPIVRTFIRRNKGVVHTQTFPPIFKAPTQLPIIRSFIRRNKAQIHQQPLPPPPIVQTARPLVRTFLRRNKAQIHLQTFPPVFTAPTQSPIVKSFIRRNRGQAKLFYLVPPPPPVPTQQPIVKTFLRRNKGTSHLQTFPPVFKAPTQRPLIRSFFRRSKGRILQVFSLPNNPPPPPTGTVAWVIISDRPAYTADIYSKPQTSTLLLDRPQASATTYNQPQTTARITDRPQTNLPFADENR
jgi:hypothetical protein